MGRPARHRAQALPHGERSRRRVVRDRARRARRLHRSERRGQVHHREGHIGHPGARLGPVRDPGPRALAGPRRPRPQHRRRLRTANAALVGPAGRRVVRAAARNLSRAGQRLRHHAGRVGADHGSRAADGRACPPAQPGPTDAVRPGGRAAASALDPVPRRADDWPGRSLEAGVPRLHQAVQPRAGRDGHPDDARHGRHRGPLHTRDGHRRGPHPLRRRAGGAAREHRSRAETHHRPGGA